VAEGRLEVKLGAVTDENGRVMPSKYGEWHEKIALFTDEEGNTIGTIGSPNESFKALSRNRESLEISRSWVENPNDPWDEARVIKEQLTEFEQLWRDESEQDRVFDFPEALRRDLIESVPSEEPEWDAVAQAASRTDEHKEELDPWPHQQQAIDRLQANGNRLLIKHATGAGKTWTTLFALREIAEPGDVVVIAVPTTDLVKQWDSQGNLLRFFPEAPILRCYGGEDWREALYTRLQVRRATPTFVISTMHTQTLRTVTNLVTQNTDPEERIFVADEVHNMGSSLRRGILDEFDAEKARIGLSATPERGDEGDDAIIGYFGTEVDVVTIEQAINELGVLSPYNYYIHDVTLDPAERNRYRELSDEITQLYFRYRGSEDDPLPMVADRHHDLKVKLMERANVVKEAAAKTDVTAEIIDSVGEKTLVYCNETSHVNRVHQALTEASTRSFGKFLGEFPDDRRDQFLSYFEAGFIDTLVSIDCLTEGVNVPAADSAILISNSTSRRESVQRRGRVLRKVEEGEVAEIHDFITLPEPREGIEDGEADMEPVEIRMVRRELDRVESMNEAARNAPVNQTEIIKLRGDLRSLESNVSNRH
jgi:superfamily II DNA or RNA helicase